MSPKEIKLTTKDEETLAFIKAFIYKHDKAPTLSEIRKFFGLSSREAINGRLRRLERKKKILRLPYTHRGIKVL